MVKLIPKERRLRAKTKLLKGKRVVPPAIRADFQGCAQEIRRHERAIKAIEQAHQKEFKKLSKMQREWLRLQGKDTDYAVDVELDQILTYFRASLVHLYAYFIRNFLGGEPLSSVGLVHRLPHLSATIEETDEIRNITLQSNPQDPIMMKHLHRAIEKLNALKIQEPHGKVMQFSCIG